METISIVRNRPHVLTTSVVRGDNLESGKVVKVVVDLLTEVGPNVVETNVIPATVMQESVEQPGVYLFPWTPTIKGEYKVRYFVDGETIPEGYDKVLVTNLEIDDLVPASGDAFCDFGSPQIFEQGDLIVLDMNLYDHIGGDLIDADTLPVVIVRNSSGVTRAQGIATRLSLGHYEFRYQSSASSPVGSWSYEWVFTLNGDTIQPALRTESWGLNPKSFPAGSDSRSGFAFGNPDLLANGGWGNIITPDELRYLYAFGNELVAPDCSTITDDTLQWYIDRAVESIERDLNFKILKKVYKYREVPGKTREDLGGLTPEIDFQWEEPYDFNPKFFQEYIYIKTRRRPILTLEKAEFRDLTGNLIIDLMANRWPKVNHEKGSIQFFPQSGTLATLPLFIGASYPLFQYSSARGEYPDAYFLDYTAGFQNVLTFKAQCGELLRIIGMLAAIALLNDYGDGRSPGLASASISLSGVSESFSTTQSATNALYGARILQFSKQIDDWYKKNKNKYGGILLGAL